MRKTNFYSLDLPRGHNDNEGLLFPYHSPEVSTRFWQRPLRTDKSVFLLITIDEIGVYVIRGCVTVYLRQAYPRVVVTEDVGVTIFRLVRSKSIKYFNVMTIPKKLINCNNFWCIFKRANNYGGEDSIGKRFVFKKLKIHENINFFLASSHVICRFLGGYWERRIKSDVVMIFLTKIGRNFFFWHFWQVSLSLETKNCFFLAVTYLALLKEPSGGLCLIST